MYRSDTTMRPYCCILTNSCKNVLNKTFALNFMVNLIILLVKVHIYKIKRTNLWLNSLSIDCFLCAYMFTCTDNKQCIHTIILAKDLKLIRK